MFRDVQRFAQVASAASYDWGGVPDIYGDGYSDQEEIMTAICTAKGASYDGMDCVGELNNATAIVSPRQKSTTKWRSVCGIGGHKGHEPCAR